MKRWAVKLLVFLLAGAIMNVAVAWGCAIWVPSPGGNARHVPYANFPLIVDYKRAEADSLRVDNPGLTFITARFTPSEFLTLTLAGWPLRSMAGAVRIGTGPSFSSGPTLVEAIELSPAVRARDPDFPNWPFVLPLRPIWPGFAINTIFYAAI